MAPGAAAVVLGGRRERHVEGEEGKVDVHLGRCGEIRGDAARYGEMWARYGRSRRAPGEIWARCRRDMGEICGDIGEILGRYWGDVGEIFVDVHRQGVVSGGGVVLDDERLVDA